MPLIDKALFSITMNLVALRIPARKSATFMKRLDGHILRKPKLRPIISDVNDESGRLLLLSEDGVDLQLTALPDHLREYERVHLQNKVMCFKTLVLRGRVVSITYSFVE